MNDDKDFIDLDSTQNWSQLDVKREMDNLEVNEETGEKYEFARGFAEDKPKDDGAVLLDGLTSGLNYIPEEFLAAADEKHEEDRLSGKVEEQADVSWAYRTDNEAKDEEPFIPVAELKKAEEEAASLRAKEVEAAKAIEEKQKQDDIEAIRQKNLEEQIEKHAQINASDEAVAANIAARKKAREEAAAQREAEIKANAEARKEAMRKAEEALFADDLEFLDEDAPVSTKEERIAAANKNGNSGFEENEYPEEKNALDVDKAATVAAVAKMAEGEADALASGDESAPKKKKKKKETSLAEDYAAWADGDMQNFEGLEKKKRKKKKAEEEILEEDDDDDDDYYYGFFGNIAHFFKKMTLLDILVACTGILVVLVAIITIMVYSSSKATQQKISEFVPLGENMQTVGLMGSEQFVAIADARNKAPEIEEPTPTPEEELKEYDEKDDESTVSVTMSLTSVKKDLKIKFINAKTKKLVSNHEFKVDIEDSNGKKYSATDDDMDGIIYLNSVTPGKAKVTMAELPNEKGITYSRETVSINIKENLDYKKIDVSDEVKSESQINAKAEDTAAGLATEGSLKDTVEWVESTKTELDGGYVKIDKASIQDPAKVTPTVTAKVSKLGVTQAVVTQKNFASGRILVAADTSATDWGLGETTVTPPEQEQPTPTAPPVTEVPTEAPATTAPTETPAETTPAATPTEAPAETPAVTPTETPAVSPSPTAGPTPTVDPKEDTTTPLKDNKGNKVYLKNEDGTYVEAKAADYYKKNLVYYRKAAEGENAKYTGWQTINNETFFFDKNGNYVTGEQVIQGAKYNFDSKGALVKGSGTLGIDVSKWNGNINWTAVKNSGVSFVIIRCGYRGSSTGALVEDPKFKTNIKGATDAGLKVGIYFFSQAITDVEAVEEASMTIDLIKSYKISYPVFLDVEDSGGRGDKIDSNTRTAVIQAFCQTMKNSGYTAGVYANRSWLTGKMNAGALSSYKIWLAQYNTEVTYTGKYDLWQYSSKGSVNGISGNTDMNLSYLGY